MAKGKRRTGGKLQLALAAATMTLAVATPIQAGDVQYGYDSVGRLISARYPNNTLVLYTYDAAGNRTRRLAESCVGAELAPTAVNDIMYFTEFQWYDDSSGLTWISINGSVNVAANDSDPSSYSLHVSGLDGVGDAYQFSGGVVTLSLEGWIPGLTIDLPGSFTYTISNGHCQADTATVTLVYQE